MLLSFVTRRTQVQNVGRAEQEQGAVAQHRRAGGAAQHAGGRESGGAAGPGRQAPARQGGARTAATQSVYRQAKGQSTGRCMAHRKKRRMQEGA